MSLTRRNNEKETRYGTVSSKSNHSNRQWKCGRRSESPYGWRPNQLGAAGSDGVRPFVQLAINMLARHKKMNTNIVFELGNEHEITVQTLRMPATGPEVVQTTIRYRNGMIATLVRDLNRNQALKS
jgi:hypothetical protein